jgi:hypothetical protein
MRCPLALPIAGLGIILASTMNGLDARASTDLSTVGFAGVPPIHATLAARGQPGTVIIKFTKNTQALTVTATVRGRIGTPVRFLPNDHTPRKVADVPAGSAVDITVTGAPRWISGVIEQR